MHGRLRLSCSLPRRPYRWLSVCAALLMGTVGCSEPPSLDLTDETIAEFATLPGLQQSSSQSLRQHFVLLEAEQATPLQLKRPEIPESENVAAVFVGLFAKNFISSQLETSDELLPWPNFTPDKKQLERIRLFRRRLEPRRAKAATALDRPKCNFNIDPTRGWYADPSFLDAVKLYMRLEAFLAVDRLAENDLTAATEAITRMFRLVELLSFEKSVNARLLAGNLRQETLQVLGAALRHPAADAKIVKHFYSLLEYQLTRWPSDADAWIGDRAMALVSYEAVRKDGLITLMTEADIRELMVNRSLSSLISDATNGADDDELFFLEEMGKIIKSCYEGEGAERRPVPYFRRQEVFVELVKAQQRKIDADEFPLVAAKLFLPNIRQGHALQAADRARVEMWTIALAAAIGLPLPEHKINPVNGERYHTTTEPRQILVLDSDGESQSEAKEIVVVPRFRDTTRRSALKSPSL